MGWTATGLSALCVAAGGGANPIAAAFGLACLAQFGYNVYVAGVAYNSGGCLQLTTYRVLPTVRAQKHTGEPVSYRPLWFSVFRGRRWRTVGLVVFFLSLVGSFALAATDQPWRDVLGVVLAAEMFTFIFAWTRWTDDQCSLDE